jgi:hypothetical protein
MCIGVGTKIAPMTAGQFNHKTTKTNIVISDNKKNSKFKAYST